MPPPVKTPSNAPFKDMSGIKNAEDAKIKIPGMDMISGIIWWSKSIKEITINTQIKQNQKRHGGVRPNLENRKTGKIPVRISTKGYLMDIGALQYLHRPCKKR